MEGDRKYLHTLILPLVTRYAVTGITRACVKAGKSVDPPVSPKQSVYWGRSCEPQRSRLGVALPSVGQHLRVASVLL